MTAPYTLIHGDALEELAKMPAGSVDAVITDPPYCSGGVSESSRAAAKGQGLRSENRTRFGWFIGDNMTTAGLTWLLRSVACETRRVLKPTGHLLCFMDWRMAPGLIPAMESGGLRYQNLIVWDKGSMGLGIGFRMQHELIAHFTNGSPKYHSADFGNVLTCQRVGAVDREHQTQKPTPLLAKMIQVVVPPGGIILDPFMGSGSTLLAGVAGGYQVIGIERDPAYVDIAQRRIEEDMPLFRRSALVEEGRA